MGKNNINFRFLKHPISIDNLEKLILIYAQIFEDADVNFFINRLNEKENICAIIAENSKNNFVGFKIGYQYQSDCFYSWVGGVLPQYRRKKIAQKLAQLQENWAKDNGFSKIRTKSMNRFKAMLILNIKNGFDIKSVYTNKLNQTKIIFEKNL